MKAGARGELMSDKRPGAAHGRWAEFRFGVIGGLLSAPPKRGELEAEIAIQARKTWTHPISGEPTKFHASTISRWYYTALSQPADLVGALRPKVRKDAGRHRARFGEAVWDVLAKLYADHPGWTYQLHSDNLTVLCEKEPKRLGPAPSYSTVRRHMKGQGWLRRRPRRNDDRPGAQRARDARSKRESRSWEATHNHALWHLDFHDAKRSILSRRGEPVYPQLLGLIDNRSRVICHLQWYLRERAEELTHGFGQAAQKRGLPRSIMMDNGPAMKAGETRQGLIDLGVQLVEIPDYSPEHNARIEALWGSVEGRLMAMLEGVRDLTLAQLNEATHAWVEHEYNVAVHSETGQTPIARLLEGPTVVRESPTFEQIRRAFRLKANRRQRHSDGTITVEGKRFEIPGAYRHFDRVTVRYARWDLSTVDLWDDRLGVVLATLYPLDRAANASGFRKPLGPVTSAPTETPSSGIAPLLQRLIDQQRETGLPPGYLPKDDPDPEVT
jgi:transposase InsO family protein